MGNLDNLSPEEKKAMDAERRAAWRKARLKSLENDAIQAQMVIQKMSELVVTTDSPIEDRDEDSSEDQQGPLSSISENPASPMTSLGNEEPDIKDLEEQDEDSRNANYVNVEFQQTNTLDIENNVPFEETEVPEVSHIESSIESTLEPTSQQVGHTLLDNDAPLEIDPP